MEPEAYVPTQLQREQENQRLPPCLFERKAMKVEACSVTNFKVFEHYELKFVHKTLDEISDRFCVLGDNGSGKTSLLQAIALTLGMATGRIHSVDRFDWIGFLPERYGRRGTPRIELTVRFSKEEIEATREISARWRDSMPQEFWSQRKYQEPGDSEIVQIRLEGSSLRWSSYAQLLQFRGRRNAIPLLQTGTVPRDLLAHLPDIFWFDQYRNLAATQAAPNDSDPTQGSGGNASFAIGVSRLRRYLNGWMLAEQGKHRYKYSYLTQLQEKFQRIFPDRHFAGVEQMPGVDSPTAEDFYFLISDGHSEYDIAEMSAGEQAVFSILYDFVRLHIDHSVVLIDEIDLNLHPPAAQLLVNELYRIGPHCQFIFTTHAHAVSAILNPEEIHRLPGGTPCL